MYVGLISSIYSSSFLVGLMNRKSHGVIYGNSVGFVLSICGRLFSSFIIPP